MRPDISCAVSTINQFMQAPYEEHMEARNHILRYLKTCPGKDLRSQKLTKNVLRLIPTLIEQDQLLTKNPLYLCMG